MADQSTGVLPGTYTYETTFTLPSNLSNARITGVWTTDNDGMDIILNGVDLGYITGFTAFQNLKQSVHDHQRFRAGRQYARIRGG